MPRNFRNRLVALLLWLMLAAMPAVAEDWKTIAQAHGVQLTYAAVGNLTRLRFTNTNSEPMTVNWTTSVQLATGKHIDNQSELNLEAGETVIIAGGPYRDAGSPTEVKNITGSLHAKKLRPNNL